MNSEFDNVKDWTEENTPVVLAQLSKNKDDEESEYAKGEGVPEDDVEAAKWYRKAAEQGAKCHR